MTSTPATGASPLVAVLGASGFIGSAVTAALARRPIRLRLVARGPVSVPPAPLAQIEERAADLTIRTELADAVADADAVVHLVMHRGGWRGADGDDESTRVNVGVVRDLAAILRDRRPSTGPPPAVIFAAAASQVGVPPRLPIDGTEPDHPETRYDRQKLTAEQELLAASADGALRGVSLRLPTVFGAGPTAAASDRGVVATMIRRALAGQTITMWHDGTVTRDLVYVRDVATAFLAALNHVDQLAGRRWLLGAGLGQPLGRVFRTVAELVARHTGCPPVPVVSVDPPGHAAPTDFHSVAIDSSAFRAVTGWAPRFPLRDALARTVAALAEPGQGQRSAA